MLFINVFYTKSDSSFKPDAIVTTFSTGDSKVDTYLLTKAEAKDLINQLKKELDKAENNG